MSYAASYSVAAGAGATINASPGQGDIANLDFGRVGWSAVVINNTANAVRVDTGSGSRWLPPWVTDLFTSDAAGAAQLAMTPVSFGSAITAGTILVTFYAANEPTPPGQAYPTFGVQGLTAALAAATQVGVNNPYVVQGGPNVAATLINPVGGAQSGVLIAAPDAAHALEIFAFVGTITPAAQGNFVELDAYVSASSFYVAFKSQWSANQTSFTVGTYVGGFVMAAGQPLKFALGAAGLNDIGLTVYYRVVPYP